ncbi:hypothetical protein OF83DRAFT_1284344 [Amylostereum chailletii]|nr:hypothetical protein OF83DRAFT_1284344 [Amylostereum chailletii]
MLSLHGRALYLFKRSEFESLASSSDNLKSYVFDCDTTPAPFESHPAFVTKTMDHFSFVYRLEHYATNYDLNFRNITHLTLSLLWHTIDTPEVVQALYDSVAKECPNLAYFALIGHVMDLCFFLKVSPPPAERFELIHDDLLDDDYKACITSKVVCTILDGISSMATGVRLVKINAPGLISLVAGALKRGFGKAKVEKIWKSLDKLLKREFDVVSWEGTKLEDIFGWSP